MLKPDYPIQSISESYSQLRKCLGLHQGYGSFSISPSDYHMFKYVIGIDMEKVPEMGWSGENTMSGQLMTLKVKSLNTGVGELTAEVMPTNLHVVLHSDAILELSDSGVHVFD